MILEKLPTVTTRTYTAVVYIDAASVLLSSRGSFLDRRGDAVVARANASPLRAGKRNVIEYSLNSHQRIFSASIFYQFAGTVLRGK